MSGEVTFKPVHELVKTALVGEKHLFTICALYANGGIVPEEEIPEMIENLETAGKLYPKHQDAVNMAAETLRKQEKWYQEKRHR